MYRFSIALLLGLAAFGLSPTGCGSRIPVPHDPATRPDTATAAGFDCSKARAADERAVCADARLSALDSEMTGLWYAYSRIPMLMGANGERQTEADEFIARRRKCGANVSCLGRAYNDRIADLRRDVARALTSFQPFISGDAGDAQPSVPTPVAAAATDYATQCSNAGGSLANAQDVQVTAGDVDGDGLYDYVVNPQPLQCTGAATALCANNGCQIRLYLSRSQYRKPISVPGGQPTLVQRDGRTDVEISVSRFNCNAAVGTACWAVYSWQDGKLRSTYRAGKGPSE